MGRHIWSLTALIFSVLVLLLALGGIVSAWVARSEAIALVDGIMTGTEQLALAGREGIAQVDPLVADVRGVVGTVENAADQLADNVADRGLVLTLLPEENAQELEARANQIRTTLESILSVAQAAADLTNAVGSLPFVDLPRPDEVTKLQEDVQALVAGIDQLATGITRFREDTAAEFAAVAERAAQVDARLRTSQENLATLDDQLVALQQRANNIKERFPLWATISAILATLVLLWVAYGMVQLIRAYWAEWRAPYLVVQPQIVDQEIDKSSVEPAATPVEELPAQLEDDSLALSLSEEEEE
jgi:hypothetical protein